jgi:hypothetical protein
MFLSAPPGTPTGPATADSLRQLGLPLPTIAFEQTATFDLVPAPDAGSSAKTTTAAMTIPVNAAVLKTFIQKA